MTEGIWEALDRGSRDPGTVRGEMVFMVRSLSILTMLLYRGTGWIAQFFNVRQLAKCREMREKSVKNAAAG
jgi:hypothetical protein